MTTSNHVTPGLGTWLIVLLSLLLVVAAARAEDRTVPDQGEGHARAPADGAPPSDAPQAAGNRPAACVHPSMKDEPIDNAWMDDEPVDNALVDDEPIDDTPIDDTPVNDTLAAAGADEPGGANDHGKPTASEGATPDAHPTGRAAAGHDHRARVRTATHARQKPCLRPAVVVVRVYGNHLEASPLRLTRCDGDPNTDVLDALSILARPHGLDRPSKKDRASAPDDRFVAPHILRVDPGLLTRLQALADHWPHHRLEIISGYRPKSRVGSRHHHGRALDVRVHGVPRAKVAAFARTLQNTGVGYYPNSVFTHIDVRHRRAFWVDRSAPGEPADYGPWPPRPTERQHLEKRILDEAFAALEKLK